MCGTGRKMRRVTDMVRQLQNCCTLMNNDPKATPTLEPIKGPPRRPAQARPPPREDANKHIEKAEESEVAGRHKNSGQKDHKGAR